MKNRKFQNLITKRGRPAALLITTVAGTMSLIYMPSISAGKFLMAAGVIFSVNIFKALLNTEYRIEKSIEMYKDRRNRQYYSNCPWFNILQSFIPGYKSI